MSSNFIITFASVAVFWKRSTSTSSHSGGKIFCSLENFSHSKFTSHLLL